MWGKRCLIIKLFTTMNKDDIELAIDDFKSDFQNHSYEFLTSKWVLEKIPYIFNNNSFLHVSVMGLRSRICQKRILRI